MSYASSRPSSWLTSLALHRGLGEIVVQKFYIVSDGFLQVLFLLFMNLKSDFNLAARLLKKLTTSRPWSAEVYQTKLVN